MKRWRIITIAICAPVVLIGVGIKTVRAVTDDGPSVDARCALAGDEPRMSPVAVWYLEHCVDPVTGAQNYGTTPTPEPEEQSSNSVCGYDEEFPGQVTCD